MSLVRTHCSREQLKDRANALAARTTTVHGGLGIETPDKSIGTSGHETALVRLDRFRGVKSSFVPGHCFSALLCAHGRHLLIHTLKVHATRVC
jgi:hypothetical protein